MLFLCFFFLQQTCDVTGCVLTLYWRKDESSLTFNQFIAPVEVKDETHQCFNTWTRLRDGAGLNLPS